MASRLAVAFAAATIGMSCIATADASATCKFKAKKDIIVIVDVGHSDKDSGQISARGVKEYDLNLKLARRVLEELVNTGFGSTQMIVTSGPNTHESRLQRSKRANDLGADLFISVHHDGVKNETLMPWQYDGKTHWFLDKFEGFSLWVSQKNNKYEESLGFAKTLADQLVASGLKFTTHHDELTNTAKYGRIAPLVDRERGIYDASDHIAVLYESHMPAVLFEAGMIVNRAEEQVLSSATRRATVAKAVATAVERFCAVSGDGTGSGAPHGRHEHRAFAMLQIAAGWGPRTSEALVIAQFPPMADGSGRLGRVVINASTGRMSVFGANRARRDGWNDANDP